MSYDDDDLAIDSHRFRQWQRAVRDETPIEYWHSLDVTRQAYDALQDAKEDQDDEPCA